MADRDSRDDAGRPADDAGQARQRRRRRDDDDPVLPSGSRDDSDVGWGDGPSRRDEDWYRRERPPHHE